MVPNNTIEQSPSWEPHRSSVSQEIPRTLCNTNVYYHIHKSPPPVHILSQINPVQSPHPTSWRSISILSSHLLLGLPSGLFPSRFSHQKPVCTSPLPHTCYMPRPSHFLRFCRPNSIWWGVQIIKFLIMQFSPLPCYFVPLRPKYSPLHPTLKHPQPMFLRYCERPSFTPIQNNTRNYNSVYLNHFWMANWKTKDSALNDSKHSRTVSSAYRKYSFPKQNHESFL